MANFAAILYMVDEEKNKEYRPQHLEYLSTLENEGKIIAKGPFVDGAGGLVVYKAESLQEAQELAEKDPYVALGARRLELHEWNASFASQN
ncbi:YciI family protein [Bacillus sp. FJAT-45350]|uniref:YciI family protein n=1 Tax=Bacillus sp. FJAT-45350 TaxID=2011014 RepID=UPI000BB73B9A|nr:YciI family protein [Bacillus sp. FJAT-45350]